MKSNVEKSLHAEIFLRFAIWLKLKHHIQSPHLFSKLSYLITTYPAMFCLFKQWKHDPLFENKQSKVENFALFKFKPIKWNILLLLITEVLLLWSDDWSTTKLRSGWAGRRQRRLHSVRGCIVLGQMPTSQNHCLRSSLPTRNSPR